MRSMFSFLALSLTLLGSQAPKTDWNELDSQVEELYQAGEYDVALVLAQRALELAKTEFGIEHLNTAQSLDALGRLYYAKADYLRAGPPLQRALAIRKSTLGLDDPFTAASLNNVASLYQARGDYANAERLFQSSLAIREKKLDPNHRDIATSLNNLGALYVLEGDYSRPVPLLTRALIISERESGVNSPDTAMKVKNLGQVYYLKANYQRAQGLYQRAHNIYKDALGADHPYTLITATNLANTYRAEGDFANAEPLYQGVQAIRERVPGPNHPDTATIVGELGILYYSKGDYARAEPLLQRALAIYESALGPDHPYVATSANNLAELYRAQKDYARAEPLYQRAIAIWAKSFPPNNPNIALPLNNLATLYDSKGDNAQAEPLLRRSLAIRKKALGHHHPETAASLNNLAVHRLATGHPWGAARLFHQALAIMVTELGPEHLNTVTPLTNLAGLAWISGRFGEAQAYIGKALQVEELSLRRVLITGFESQKQAYLDTLRGTTDDVITMALSTPFDPGRIMLAFTAVTQRKGRVLEAISKEMNALRRRLSNEDQQTLNELTQTRTLLAQLQSIGLAKRSAADYQREVRQLADKEDRLQAAVSAHSVEFRVDEQIPTAREIQGVLPKSAALIEFARYRPVRFEDLNRWGPARYAAFVLPSQGQVVGVDLGDASRIDDLCSQFTLSIGVPANAGQTREIARELDAKLMQPLRRLLGGSVEVLISPDGALNLIPFAALIDENQHYLLEQYQFTYLGTSRDLLRLQQPSASRQPAYIVANPVFGVSQASGGCHFEPRIGFAEEADAIAARFPNAEKMFGDKASKEGLQRLAGPLVLHVATHGFFDTSGDCIPKDASPMLRSGLALAGANDRSELGIMTALEIADLDLWGTQLVVLSSCETGVGETRDGEGVFGLRRALVIAGARTQVVSLWEVDDESTRDLMVGYYDRLLSGEGRSAALRAEQLEMLKDGRDPSSWAAFIPSGDWTPLGH